MIHNVCISYRLIVVFWIVEDMIRLFKVKEKQKELAKNANGESIKKQSAGELRLHKGDALLSDITYFHQDVCIFYHKSFLKHKTKECNRH